MSEILCFQGFIQASIFKQDQEERLDQKKLTVQYQLKNRNDLERYFTECAPRMREEGIRRFNNNFSATRRVFEVQEVILK